MTCALYATSALIACTIYVALLAFVPEYRSVGALGRVTLIFALRAAAIRWDLAMSDWLVSKTKAG